jgi:hAT family C-terminal dimerisation region
MQLGERFDTASSGISTYIRLESVLLDGEVTAHEELISGYPELDVNTLSTQLGMFHSQWKYNNLSGAVEVIHAMSEDVHRLFPQVDRLVRLMLICPVSSCEAERSFSSLRRLKTWLRNSMTQSRLNAIAVCHAHQDVLDAVDLERLAEEFISRSNTRKMAFGHGAFK